MLSIQLVRCEGLKSGTESTETSVLVRVQAVDLSFESAGSNGSSSPSGLFAQLGPEDRWLGLEHRIEQVGDEIWSIDKGEDDYGDDEVGDSLGFNGEEDASETRWDSTIEASISGFSKVRAVYRKYSKIENGGVALVSPAKSLLGSAGADLKKP
ncbi:hypothetical protein Bca52824_023563 [Brassica carinata]|uniref:Uncharacterized protein n=1 Tax=Brassica carinata TaxID=52824 RepID=A0A8X7VIX0_BRACI|nr:hypothetical protein Bca52824_023563 [Brassica carinata]